METLLHINSNRDDHTEYTKTRVADQAGNFIILGDDAVYDDVDYKFPKGTTGSGQSLVFDGEHPYHLNDYYHTFNFAAREFSMEAWVKFEGEQDLDKKHVIVSKWSDDFEEKHNKIFRWSYIHNGENPDDSQIKFEYAGAKGYPNENYPSVILRGYDGEYDGEYKLTNELVVPDEYENYHMWQGENGVLLMHKYEDPIGYANPSISSIASNYIINSSWLSDWTKTGEEWEIIYDRLDTMKLPTENETSTLLSDLSMDLSVGKYRLSFLYEQGETISEKSFLAYFNKKPTPTTYKGWYDKPAALSKGPDDGVQDDSKIQVYHQGTLDIGTVLYIDEELTTRFVLTPDDRWIYSRDHTYAMRLVDGEVVEVGHHTPSQTLRVCLLNEAGDKVFAYSTADEVSDIYSSTKIIPGVNQFELTVDTGGLYRVKIECDGNDSVSNAYLRGMSFRYMQQIDDTIGYGKTYLAKLIPEPTPTPTPSDSPTSTSTPTPPAIRFDYKFTDQWFPTSSPHPYGYYKNWVDHPGRWLDGITIPSDVPQEIRLEVKTNSNLPDGALLGTDAFYGNEQPIKDFKLSLYDQEYPDLNGIDPIATIDTIWCDSEVEQNLSDNSNSDLYVTLKIPPIIGNQWGEEVTSCNPIDTMTYDYDFDSLINVTAHMEDGNHATHTCGNLQDGNWHYIYLSFLYEMDESSILPKPVVDLGIDNTYIRLNAVDANTSATITYVNNRDGTPPTPDKIEYLSSIQPHFQHLNNAYLKKTSIQELMIGADGVSGETFVGKLDTLRVSEYPVYENQQEYVEGDRSTPPECVIFSQGIDNVCKYDEHTEYIIDEVDPIDIQIFQPTYADAEIPTNAFELYKKHIGSMEYLKTIWKDKDSEPTDLDLNKWRWELKFIAPPWFINRTGKQVSDYQQDDQRNVNINSPDAIIRELDKGE